MERSIEMRAEVPRTSASSMAWSAGRIFVRTLEVTAAALLCLIIGLLLMGVFSRYVMGSPIVWVDEVIAIAFLWLAMFGTIIALERHEHLRLTVFTEKLPERLRAFVETFSSTVIAAFMLFLIGPAVEYVESESIVRSIALDLPGSLRVSAFAFGLSAMAILGLVHAFRYARGWDAFVAIAVVGGSIGAFWLLGGVISGSVAASLSIYLGAVAVICLVGGVPIAFCFGAGTLCFLAFASSAPLIVMIGRMDEGMSSMILVSVPIFVLLGCILDNTGMGKAIIDFLSSLIGHVRAGLSYVLLGALFVVSGISGSKVSDMATVAPALFPEMQRRGQEPREMVALLGTGAAMADTVPPSIMLIVLGSVAGVSIAGLFNAGIVVAAVLLAALLVVAWIRSPKEAIENLRRAPVSTMLRTMLIAAPALTLPFLIRGAVGGGVATATEVSTIAVVYALLLGAVLYGGIRGATLYRMLVDSASLTGAILMILGTALAMSWALAQSGLAHQIESLMAGVPGGWIGFLVVSVFVFLIFGSLLEGMPALLLLAPMMFPIARDFGIHDVHYAMVVVVAMNIGLMMPPIGVGFYIACRIGGVSPDLAMGATWPYILALLGGLSLVVAFPVISTGFL